MQFLLSLPSGSEWLIVLLILVGVVFWIYTIVDIVRSKFKDETTKIAWLLITIFLGFIGAIIYSFLGKPSKID
jgi:uncharacterized membrane protein